MRIAVLSDIHSNIYALEAVIAHLTTKAADTVVNLGDILYGPIAPRETFDLLQQQNFVTIRGNQDRQIYEADADELKMNSTLQFIVEDLGGGAMEWLRELPFDCQLNNDVYLCHGTPDNDLIYLLEDVQSGQPRLRADHEIESLLGGQRSPLVLCGHTHIPRAVTTRSGQLVVNPGSVGLPAYDDTLPSAHVMETFSHHASYALVTGQGRGWNVEHIKVDYDAHKAARAASARGREDWARSLETGRAQSAFSK